MGPMHRGVRSRDESLGQVLADGLEPERHGALWNFTGTEELLGRLPASPLESTGRSPFNWCLTGAAPPLQRVLLTGAAPPLREGTVGGGRLLAEELLGRKSALG